MIIRTIFTIFISFIILMIAASTFAGSQDVFGPEDFEIGSWHANLSRRTFTVNEPGDGVINITKSTPDKEIRGGFLLLNWKLIPLQDFLSGNDLIIEKDVALKRFNRLTLFLRGDPGASVKIAVSNEGVTILPPEVSLNAEPLSIIIGDSATLSWESAYADRIAIDQGIGEVSENGSIVVTPQETTTYVVSAGGEGGISSADITVTVTQMPPRVEIAASPPSIKKGGITTLSWNSTWADTCVIEPGIGVVDLDGSYNISPDATTTYTIVATNEEGTSQDQVIVQVTEPAPWVTLSSDVETIIKGESAILSWNAQNAASCNIEPEIGMVDQNGSVVVTPTETETYTITATGPGGAETSRVTITVLNVPVIQISTNPANIFIGNESTLSWTTEHAQRVTIDNGIGEVAINGSFNVSPEEITTYTMTASGPGGTATASTTISVIYPPPTIELITKQHIIPSGGSAVLTWSTEHANICSIEPDIGSVGSIGTLTVTPKNTTTYKFIASGIGGTASRDLIITVNQPPSIFFEKPGSENVQADTTCLIKWSDSDIDDNAKISLYYDTDKQGANGNLIVSGIHEDFDDENEDRYVWDTVDLPKGDYYLYAVIDDQVNAPVVVYAEGMIVITHPSSIPDAILSASDADAEDFFGESVVIGGNTALIGASGDDERGVDAGAIYVFRKDKSGWMEQDKIMPDDAAAGDHFGAAIAGDGEFAVVGAYGSADNTGAAYVFMFDGNNWIQHAKLTADDGMRNDYFGTTLDISNGFVIVGAYGRNINGPNTGAAYIFQYNDKGWIQVAKLTADMGSAEDYFGGSVAICGDYALVGAPGTDQVGTDSGKAYVYQYDGNDWMLNAALAAPDGASGDYFGTSVALNHEFLMIGATGAKTIGETIPGAVYAFYDNGKQWIQSARITAGIPENNGMDASFYKKPLALDRLMASLTPWDDVAWVDWIDSFGGRIKMGERITAIRIMREHGGSRIKIVRPTTEDPEQPDETPGWEPVAIISSDGSEADDGFGEGIDIEDGTIIVGSPNKDGNDIDTGEVAIYSVEISSGYQEVKLTAGKVETEPDKFGEALAADGNTLIIGATADESSGFYSGAAHIFMKNDGEWIKQTTLTADDADHGDYFGVSVDIEGEFAVVGAFRKQINGIGVGAAYIFQNIAGTWTQTAKLLGDELIEEAWFGATVSISNGFAVVGAPNENMGTGAAYLFHYNGTTWEPYGKLRKNGEEAVGGDYFAESVSIDGNHLIIGIPGESEDNGAIMFYRFDGNDWVQQTKVSRFGYEFFGESVSISGDYAIAGRPGDNLDLGAAYIYQWDGADWIETAELRSGENFSEVRFGAPVVITDQYAIVGSANNSPVSGAAFIYQNDKGSWVQIAKISASDTSIYHAFASAVAISGESFVIGSFKNYTVNEFGGSEEDFCGAVYIYSTPDITGGTGTSPSVSINATSNIVLPGGSSTLAWSATNVSACTITPDIGTVDLEGSMKIYPNMTTTYTVIGQGPDGVVEDSVTIFVVAGETPAVTLDADPAVYRVGESVTLFWNSENAAFCTIDQNIGGVDLTGAMTVQPTKTTTYTISAPGFNGTATASVTVTPDQTPTVHLAASAKTIEKGGTVTLQWNSTYADSAYIEGIGGVPVNAGAVIVLNETTTFTITVTGPEGTATDSVTVTAIDPVPTVSIIAIPEAIHLGESTALGWLSEHADAVVLEPGFGEELLKGSRIVYPTETTTYTVTATGPGGTASAIITVTVINPIELTITSPLHGDTINRPDVMVQGTFSHIEGLETGIIINGVPAMIYGNQFVANHVPLLSGEETIQVLATDTSGITNRAGIFLNVDFSDHYITLNANPESGLSPLETRLKVDGTFSIMDSSITNSDTAAVEYLESGLDTHKVVVTGQGFYYFTANVTHKSGDTYSDTIAILAQDRDEFDAKLQTKWNGMKTDLMNDNTQEALKHFHDSSKDNYQKLFSMLSSNLSDFASSLQGIELIYSENDIAQYRIKKVKIINGVPYDITFYVYFMKDKNGIWKIQRF